MNLGISKIGEIVSNVGNQWLNSPRNGGIIRQDCSVKISICDEDGTNLNIRVINASHRPIRARASASNAESGELLHQPAPINLETKLVI